MELLLSRSGSAEATAATLPLCSLKQRRFLLPRKGPHCAAQLLGLSAVYRISLRGEKAIWL